jgi:hypothetical protein
MNIIEKKIKNNIIYENENENDNENDNENKSKTKNISYDKPITKLQLSDYLKEGTSCELVVINNFYNNPMETRNYILTQDFNVKGNFPGKRTISYASEELKSIIQAYIKPFGEIVSFPIPTTHKNDFDKIYNGAFQYTTALERSWVHTDRWNNWAGVLYLTPEAPLSSGTGFYRFKDGAMNQNHGIILNNQEEVDKCTQDMTKWELVDTIGNVFNRLILFNSHRYHMSMNYFGNNKENGRLFQVFFFSTK